MKNLTVILLFILTLNSQAQTYAPDFTLTDIHGVSRNLYAELDAGKQVILEFFMTNCGTCQINTPILEEYWQNYGFGGDSIWIWSIEVNNATDSLIEAFYIQYPASFPAFSTINNTVIISDYNVTYTPMYFAICPNRFMKTVSISSIGNNDVSCPTEMSSHLNNYFPTEIIYMNENNILFVKNISLESESELSIFSIYGELINKIRLNTEEYCLNMENYRNGLYFVSINTNSGRTKSTKVVIHK
jgi:thiol-disulfide isomerase/thioredoxin